MSELIGRKEAASILKCSPSTLSRYVSTGKLSLSQNSNNRMLFDKEKILDFIKPSNNPRIRPNFNQHAESGIEKSAIADIVEKCRVNPRDSASADVQIGIYTEKIRQLEIEMKRISTNNPYFINMRYTLLRHVGERRRLLRYLESSDYSRYRRATDLMKSAHKTN